MSAPPTRETPHDEQIKENKATKCPQRLDLRFPLKPSLTCHQYALNKMENSVFSLNPTLSIKTQLQSKSATFHRSCAWCIRNALCGSSSSSSGSRSSSRSSEYRSRWLSRSCKLIGASYGTITMFFFLLLLITIIPFLIIVTFSIIFGGSPCAAKAACYRLNWTFLLRWLGSARFLFGVISVVWTACENCCSGNTGYTSCKV